LSLLARLLQVNTIRAYMNQLEYGMARAQERMGEQMCGDDRCTEVCRTLLMLLVGIAELLCTKIG